jgi:hypothetical protein
MVRARTAAIGDVRLANCVPASTFGAKEFAAGTTPTAIALTLAAAPRDGEFTLILRRPDRAICEHKDWICGISVAPLGDSNHVLPYAAVGWIRSAVR